MSSSQDQPSVYLIRHGETEWSLSSQHTSTTEMPLTEGGERAAKLLGERLHGVSFSHVFTSPRQRAQRTCALAALPAKTEVETDLTEWNYGEYEGRRSTEIHQERPDWNIFRDGCPQGETALQVSNRADQLMAKLRTLQGNIALFTHGQFACVFAARWIGLPVWQAQHFVIDPATLSILGYGPNHHEVPAIVTWNSASVPMPVLKRSAADRKHAESGREASSWFVTSTYRQPHKKTMNSMPPLTGSHLRIYNRIFQHPISHNLEWRDVHALFGEMGEVKSEANGNLKVTRNGHSLVLHPPHIKDVPVDEIMTLRHFLKESETASTQ